jgi:predicted molibdopterin-dependent oxidoreductase YjgC
LRDVIGTSNIDHYHGRFQGARDQFTGQPWRMSNSIAEIEKASHIVLIASDPYQRQPILNLRIKKAIKAGTQVYIVNADATELDRLSALKINIPTHGAGASAKLLLKYALQNVQNGNAEIAARARQNEQSLTTAEQDFGPAVVEQLKKLAAEIVSAKGAIILYDELATLEPGAEELATDVQALAVATGNTGRAGAGAGPLFGNANSLGARDMGLLPDALPGYQAPSQPGLSYSEILSNPQIKALFVMGANPARHLSQAQLPSTLEFVVVQDLVLSETARQADVVLPAVTFAEKDGTMTNVDQHVQVVRRALRPLPGARADWEILTDLARYLGQKWGYANPAAIFAEIAASHPFYSGLNLEELGRSGVRVREQEVTHA